MLIRSLFAYLIMVVWCVALQSVPAAAADAARYDVLISGGTVYDGSGGAPFVGDVAISGDRIAYVGPHAPRPARERVDAHGKAVAPGFVNMLAHPEASLLVDGRALSDLRQGVTLEVLGEDSMGPLNAADEGADAAAAGRHPLRDRLDDARRVSAAARATRHCTERRLLRRRRHGAHLRAWRARRAADRRRSSRRCATWCARPWRRGRVGVTTALIYSPNEYARTPELIALATESARCGGIYSVHMRSEGDRLLEAVQETIDIARASGAPAEIYHLKVAGQRNWNKLDALIAAVDKARAAGHAHHGGHVRVHGGRDRDSMPRCRPWVQDGGLEAWIERLRDPTVRARVVAEMRDPTPAWENLYGAAGADGTLLLAFKNPALKPLTGKTLAEVAQLRGVSPRMPRSIW